MSESKSINGFPHIPFKRTSPEASEMMEISENYYQWLDQRRTVRDISSKPVPQEVIEKLVLAASTAPSGAHKQPWTFCLVQDAEIKQQIRKAAGIARPGNRQQSPGIGKKDGYRS